MIPLTAIPRKLRNGYRKFRTYYHRMRRLKDRVARTPPMPVNPDGPVQIHMLCSRYRLNDGIATLKSFYRFLPDRHPLYFHDDGSLTPAQADTLRRHFPGVNYIPRADADPLVEAHLSRIGLQACINLRRSQNFQLKLFDFAVYAKGRPFLQLDSDILFFKPPTELLDALCQPAEKFVDRYNEQHIDCYTWTAEQVKSHLGLDLLPRVNVGVMCLRRDDESFRLFERCLAMPVLEQGKTYFWEQSLTAIESSRRGGAPLSPEYDVVGIHQQQGRDVVSEHYCDTYRPLFYDHFCDRVAPELGVRG